MVLVPPPSSIHGGRKTPATLFFLLLLHLHYATILVSTTSAAHPAPAPSPALTTTTYIKSCCKTTTYPRLCYATLLPYADQIKGDSKLLAGKSLSVALTAARASSSTMKRLAGLRGLSPRVKGAVGDCVRLVGDSVIQLGRSVDELGSSGSGSTIGTNFQFEVSSVKTWVSTAVTDAYTCMNEFDEEGMNGNVKIIVGRHMLKLAQLTSNALSLINGYYASSAKNKNAAAAHHHQVHHP